MAKMFEKEGTREKFKEELGKLDPEDISIIRDIVSEVLPPEKTEKKEKGILETAFPFAFPEKKED